MYAGTDFRVPGTGLRVAIIADREKLPLYQRPGDGQLFVAGKHGQEFQILVKSEWHGRLLVVPAIDHRAVLEDKAADVNGKGLIIPAYADYLFTGWRQDNDTTLPFVFTFPEHSVAQQASGPVAVTGVMGFAVYSENSAYQRHASYDWDEPVYRGGAAPATRAAPGGRMAKGWGGQTTNSVGKSDLGTGVGSRRQHDAVTEGSFERGGMSLARLLYATHGALEVAGLTGPAEPPAFPEQKAFQNYKSV